MVIEKSLDPLRVPIKSLHLLDNNPRQGNIEALMNSLNAFGQMKPVVYRLQKVDGQTKRKRVIIAGNHTVMAATELGWEEIAAVDATRLTDAEAKAFAIADNRIHELGYFEDAALKDFLKEVQLDGDELLKAKAFTTDEVNRILHSNPDPDLSIFDDLIGDDTASWSEDTMSMPDILKDQSLVPFQVMMTADDRHEAMQTLKQYTADKEYASTGDALLAMIRTHGG